MLSLSGKVAIVTGASRGIGAAIAKELATNGAKVVVNYATSEGPAREVVDWITGQGGEAVCVRGDVSLYDHAEVLARAAKETFGRIDILVNNAGITRDRTLRKMQADAWIEVIEVNLNSVYNCTSAVLPYMLEQGAGGSIISISSIIGQAGGFGQTNYAAAKAGIIGFTKSAALELARNKITVNAICPGFIATDMLEEVPPEVREKIQAKIPLGRFGSSEEVARTVLFLAVEGQYITGQCLNINGGLYM